MGVMISAIVCTWNRIGYLRRALESLTQQSLAKDQYEIIVVDNGSTDNTKQIVLERFSYLSNLQYLYEPVQGLSRARNTGWRNARGEYIAYLDDDAVASSEWLEKIIETFEALKPQPGCVTGKISPIWEAQRPSWLSDKMVPSLTVVDWSGQLITLNNNQWLAGANMAFPKRLIEAEGGFREDLGRRGKKLLSMEEALLRRQLEKKGYRCVYNPEIIVQHHIPAGRLTQRWFMRRVYWDGISSALLLIHLNSPSALRRLRKAASASRNMLLLPQQLLNLILPTNNPNRFTFKCSALVKVGYIFGLLGIAK